MSCSRAGVFFAASSVKRHIQVVCLLLFALYLRKTSCHATPRMAAVRCPFGMCPCDEGAEATIGEVASCSPSKFRGPWTFRAIQAYPSTGCHCQKCPPRVQAEPHARGCCLRGSGRGQEVGSSNCSPWGGQCPCQGSPRSSADCQGKEHVAPGCGAGGARSS